MILSWPLPRLTKDIELIVVVRLLSCVWLFVTPWTAAHQASLSFTISWNLLKLRSIESVMPSKHLILCCPLLLLPSIFPSIRVFSNELALHISISPSYEYSELISFRIDWFDLAVQGTLKSLLQHHISKESIPWHSAFFMVQLSHLYITTGKVIVWLDKPLWTKQYLCFLTCCLGLSQLFFQEASIF